MILNEPIVIRDKNTVIENQSYEAGEGLRGKPMFYIGDTTGVELRNVEMFCNGIAGAGISAWDLEASVFTNVYISHPTQVGVYLIGIKKPLRQVDFYRLRIETRSPYLEQCQDASALVLDSLDTTIANVCFCHFFGCFFDTARGTCVDLRDADNCLFLNTHCINLGDGYALRIGKRDDNTFITFEAHRGKVEIPRLKRNTFIGWSLANGAQTLPL